MNLDKIPKSGTTIGRKRFWDKARDIVVSLQKKEGRNVSVDERKGAGTVINVLRPDNQPQNMTGACCIGTDCSIQTQADCEGSGGVYLGDGTTCEGSPCGGGGTGRPCCYPDGSCSDDISDEACAAGGGESWGTSSDHCGDYDPPCCPCARTTVSVTGTMCFPIFEEEDCVQHIDYFAESYYSFGSTGGDFCCDAALLGGEDNHDGTYTIEPDKGWVNECGGGCFWRPGTDIHILDCIADQEITVISNGPCIEGDCEEGTCGGGECEECPTGTPTCVHLTMILTLENGVCAP